MAQGIIMSNSEKIIIDLSETDTKAFDDANFIQRDARDVFRALAKEFISKSKSDNKSNEDCSKKKDNDCNSIDRNKEFVRVHNTILINGKRGMGKSSFALHMKHNLKDLNICVLPIIDPTLIESKEHVLLNIITLVKEKVENYTKCDKCDTNDYKYKNWRESLRLLAGGLSMLDGIGSNHLSNNDLWDSPELILEKGLSNSKHGYKLEENFHKYIESSLDILCKEAFFITLDDIDTSLDKGLVILEILRKYLTSPKLIIALLGDIELYSTLVRQLQWQKIDPYKILKDYEFGNGQKDKNKEDNCFEYASKNKYLDQIEHLEEQYLVKVLKPENRISLKTILELEDKILIKKRHSEEAESLIAFLEEMLAQLFLLSKSSSYHTAFKMELLSQSTRSLVQILKVYDDEKNLSNEVVNKFKHTFFTTLYKNLLHHNLLDIQSPERLMNIFSIFILKSEISRDNNLELLPEFVSSEKNITMTYLNLVFNNYVKQKDYLSYFIKIGYTLERYENIDKKDEECIEISHFINHVGINNNEPNSRIAKRLLTTFEINPNTFKNSIMSFGNLSIKDEQFKTIKRNKNISLLLSKVYNPKGGRYSFLSFFNLLGILADIVGKEKDEAIAILKKNDLIRDYYLYKVNNATFQNNDKDEDDNAYGMDGENSLFDELSEWQWGIARVEKLPPFVLAKIWIRTVYTIHDIETRSVNKNKNYLELFELYIAGFLNAVYTQIELYKNNQNVSLRNPSTDKTFFAKKLLSEKTYVALDYTNDIHGTIVAINQDNYKQGKLWRQRTSPAVKYEDIEYTLFSFLYDCPILKDFNKYFKELGGIKLSSTDITTKANQKQSIPTDQDKIDKIKAISGWENMEAKAILKELQKSYSVTSIASALDKLNHSK